jgi:hypothetical protein
MYPPPFFSNITMLWINNSDDDKEEEVDSDDMEYIEDAIDNMILEFSGD